MEKTKTRECHDHIVVIAPGDNGGIANGTAGLGNIAHAASISALDVVRKGKNASDASAAPLRVER